MIDREKIIKAVEEAFDMYWSEYGGTSYFDAKEWAENKRDALALLKEQEAVEPHYTTMRYLVNGMEVAIQHPECPRCIENGLVLWDAEIEKGQAYCKRCGQKVKWE